jgi:hypothetical protein
MDIEVRITLESVFFLFKLSTRKSPLTETKMKLRLDESSHSLASCHDG